MDIRKPISSQGGDSILKFLDLWKKQASVLKQKFGVAIEEIRMPLDDLTDVPIVYVQKDSIISILKFLKEDSEFEYRFLADITATDEESEPRFELVYNLFSHQNRCRIRVKVRVRESDAVATAVSVWEGANWAEREVYDMFGIRFDGHPDLRRILMDHRWVGYPLRKDYPLRGYQMFVDSEPVNLSLLEQDK